MKKDQCIGITEASDPCFNLDLFDNLYQGNIIITKNLTDALISKLVEFQDKIILHHTVTGMGGTIIEPNVPTFDQSYDKLTKLLNSGFPVAHVVLRIDPVVPTEKGIQTAVKVIEKFSDLGITRVRWSSMDMYNHVKANFLKLNINLPYNTFNAPNNMISNAHDILEEHCKKYNMVLECCGEFMYKGSPCISQKDIDILGLTDKIKLIGKKDQRPVCECPMNKKELIIKGKPRSCEHKCLYCFWKS